MELIERLRDSSERLHAAVASLPQERWTAPASGGGWSAAEIVAHLVVVERRIVARLRSGEQPSGSTDGKERALEAFMPVARRKVVAGELSQPRDMAPDPAAGLAAFDAARAETLEWLATSPELDAVGGDHPSFGSLNGSQWMLAMALHTIRHAAQIEALNGG